MAPAKLSAAKCRSPIASCRRTPPSLEARARDRSGGIALCTFEPSDTHPVESSGGSTRKTCDDLRFATSAGGLRPKSERNAPVARSPDAAHPRQPQPVTGFETDRRFSALLSRSVGLPARGRRGVSADFRLTVEIESIVERARVDPRGIDRAVVHPVRRRGRTHGNGRDCDEDQRDQELDANDSHAGTRSLHERTKNLDRRMGRTCTAASDIELKGTALPAGSIRLRPAPFNEDLKDRGCLRARGRLPRPQGGRARNAGREWSRGAWWWGTAGRSPRPPGRPQPRCRPGPLPSPGVRAVRPGSCG